MTDLITLVQRFLNFKAEAEHHLSKHESSTSRVITIENTYRKLAGLSLKQDDLLRQAFRCVEHEIFRGAHVLAWAAMVDYLEEWLASDGFTKLATVRPAWGITSLAQLRESYPEFQIIEALRACEYIEKGTEKALKGLLDRRNKCAHPSNYLPDLNMTLGYLSELLHWFARFEAERTQTP